MQAYQDTRFGRATPAFSTFHLLTRRPLSFHPPARLHPHIVADPATVYMHCCAVEIMYNCTVFKI